MDHFVHLEPTHRALRKALLGEVAGEGADPVLVPTAAMQEAREAREAGEAGSREQSVMLRPWTDSAHRQVRQEHVSSQ
jgi:hypothetical protein